MLAFGTTIAMCTAIATESKSPPASAHKVALIVQNHCAPGAGIPMMALTDALTARLSGKGLQVINPYNAVGGNENRTVAGEKLPKMSAIELAQGLEADGVITASVIEFLDTTIGNPPVLHQYVVRLAFSLADASTGATVCGETIKVKSRQYTISQDRICCLKKRLIGIRLRCRCPWFQIFLKRRIAAILLILDIRRPRARETNLSPITVYPELLISRCRILM